MRRTGGSGSPAAFAERRRRITSHARDDAVPEPSTMPSLFPATEHEMQGYVQVTRPASGSLSTFVMSPRFGVSPWTAQ